MPRYLRLAITREVADGLGACATNRRMITIAKLTPEDRAAWEDLFRGYNEFYERTLTPPMADRAWTAFQSDAVLHAFGARLDGRLVGIAHFLVHPSTTAPDVCYLQDLFTAPDARGQGVARTLITAVDRVGARASGCSQGVLVNASDQRHRPPAVRPGGREPRLHPVPDLPLDPAPKLCS